MVVSPGGSDENGSNSSVGKGRGVDSINTVSVANCSLEVTEFMMVERDGGAMKNLLESSGLVLDKVGDGAMKNLVESRGLVLDKVGDGTIKNLVESSGLVLDEVGDGTMKSLVESSGLV